jgi:hypothetical protein
LGITGKENTMCYGCELKSTLGEKTMYEYLDIRYDYAVMNGHITALLDQLLAFEKTITDCEQRKAWHATRARLAKAKKIAGEAMSQVRPNAMLTHGRSPMESSTLVSFSGCGK